MYDVCTMCSSHALFYQNLPRLPVHITGSYFSSNKSQIFSRMQKKCTKEIYYRISIECIVECTVECA